MTKALKDMYYDNLRKVQAGEITREVWYEICTNLLAQMMIDDMFKNSVVAE